MPRISWTGAGLALSLTLAAAPRGAPGSRPASATAYFAGGCFWGVEMVFEHVRGVRSATSGYAHWADRQGRPAGGVPVETVKVEYDPSQVSYPQLLEVFFRIAHDPTSRDRQGPDAGPEYRAIVFFTEPAQRQAAEHYLAGLRARRVFAGAIVTEIQPLGSFRVAESFHQDFAARHPTAPYIVVNDLPKLDRLRRDFPALFKETPTTDGAAPGARSHSTG